MDEVTERRHGCRFSRVYGLVEEVWNRFDLGLFTSHDKQVNKAAIDSRKHFGT